MTLHAVAVRHVDDITVLSRCLMTLDTVAVRHMNYITSSVPEYTWNYREAYGFWMYLNTSCDDYGDMNLSDRHSRLPWHYINMWLFGFQIAVITLDFANSWLESTNNLKYRNHLFSPFSLILRLRYKLSDRHVIGMVYQCVYLYVPRFNFWNRWRTFTILGTMIFQLEQTPPHFF